MNGSLATAAAKRQPPSPLQLVDEQAVLRAVMGCTVAMNGPFIVINFIHHYSLIRIHCNRNFDFRLETRLETNLIVNIFDFLNFEK